MWPFSGPSGSPEITPEALESEEFHLSLCELRDLLCDNLSGKEIDFTASGGETYQVINETPPTNAGYSRFRIKSFVEFSDIMPDKTYTLTAGEDPSGNLADRAILMENSGKGHLLSGAAAVRAFTRDLEAHFDAEATESS